jgi:arylsulfatase A-like enzyme
MPKQLVLILSVLLCVRVFDAHGKTLDASPSSPRPLNIVFILSDNQSAEALPLYGNQDVATPHLDRLAQRGVRYDNAFAVSGMCSPTRATLMTGLIPSQHGLHNALHDAWVEGLDDGWSGVHEFRTLPLTLQQRGYQTAMIGKWHIGDPRQPQIGFEHWVSLPYGHTRDFWHNQLIENGRFQTIHDRHVVDVLAEKAVDYLRQVDPSKPFYLQLNLDGPYALPPTNYGPARNRHYARYANAPFQSMPVEPINDQVLARLKGPFVEAHRIEDGIEDMSLDEIWNSILYRTIRMQNDRASYANFLSQNTVVDDAVGTVWRELEARGMDKNTVVVYSADQGNLFGQHGSWGHTIWFFPSHLFDSAMKIPLIVYHPDAKRPGSASEQLIAQYDIAPTLLDLAGVSSVQFEHSPGISFAHTVVEDAVPKAHSAVFFEQEESRGIRTDRYAYWKRLDGMGQPVLFDVKADPEQREDLYPSLSGSHTVQQLDAQLDEFFARYSKPEYDLWQGGTSKGTMPNPVPWIKKFPLPWLKKLFRDYVTEPVVEEPYAS